MMSCKYYILISALLCFNAPVNAATLKLDPAREAGLIPHKALYEIRLSSKKSSAKVANISGKMYYEWQPACDAWISNHRFDMVYEYIEAPQMRITSDFSTYESFDGKEFNFTMQRKNAGIVFEELRGAARDGEIIYSLPDGLAFDMPKETLFPMKHTLEVLKQIKAGDKFYKATLFDGSDTDGPADVNSFILPSKTSNIDINTDLLKSKSWHIRLAFFPLSNSEITSDYEMSAIFHENGIISDMEVDYKDFSVTQKLIAIEALGDACLSAGQKDIE